jgi:serine/threonine-protein kinase
MAVMNDRLINYPTPPQVADPSISPQMQEVIYRALERDPRNRYAKARDFIYDLKNLDKVGIADRVELREWHKRKSMVTRNILYYGALALLPVVLLLVMFLLAHRH